MTTEGIKLWAGIAFAAAVFILLACIFFKTPVLTTDQQKILRLFGALLAGCAGVFLSGAALFAFSEDTGTTKTTVQGTAGFASFFVVWFTFNPLRKQSGATAISITFVDNMSFQKAAEILGQLLHLAVDLDALEPNEKTAKLKGVNVQAKDPKDILAKLNAFVQPPERVRPYDLEADGVVLKIIPKSP